MRYGQTGEKRQRTALLTLGDEPAGQLATQREDAGRAGVCALKLAQGVAQERIADDGEWRLGGDCLCARLMWSAGGQGEGSGEAQQAPHRGHPWAE